MPLSSAPKVRDPAGRVHPVPGHVGIYLRCPYCSSRAGNVVINSRRTGGRDTIRRRRECLTCRRRWTTYEFIEDPALPPPPSPPMSEAARREVGVALGHLDRGEAARAREALAGLLR